MGSVSLWVFPNGSGPVVVLVCWGYVSMFSLNCNLFVFLMSDICILCICLSRHRSLAADMMTCKDLEGEMGKPAWSQWPVAHRLPLQGPTQTLSWCQSAGNDHNPHRWHTFHAVHIRHGMKEGNLYFFGLFWTCLLMFTVILWKCWWFYQSDFSAGNFLFFLSQKRTREKLVNVLSLCGQEVGLTKNPSVSPHCHCRSWEDTLCRQPYILLLWG